MGAAKPARGPVSCTGKMDGRRTRHMSQWRLNAGPMSYMLPQNCHFQKVFGQRGAHLEISVPRKLVSADRKRWGNAGPTHKTSARLCPKHHVEVGAHQTVPWQYYLLLAQFLNKANESDVSRLLAG